MITPIILFAVAFVMFSIYGSFFEWTIHRFAMHRPVPLIHVRFFFKGHALDHHRTYASDDSYLVGSRPRDDLTLGWSAIAPILIHSPLMIAIAVWLSVPVAVGWLVAFALYEAFYEYLHYCMHVPTGRWLEKTPVFKWLNTHHLQHHRKHNSNLNVLLPIADYVMRTRRTWGVGIRPQVQAELTSDPA